MAASDILIKSAAIMLTNPVINLLLGSVSDSIALTGEFSKSEEITKLEDESQRQEFALRMNELQARVTQETAIAARIERAEEVEIEEYYEGSGSRKVGLNLDEEGVSLGAAGRGRRVTKRIYRFRGVLTLSSPMGGIEETFTVQEK